MRRIFTNRAKVMLYFEAEEIPEFEKKARNSGKTLQEWMREAVRASLKGANGDLAQDVSRVGAVRVRGERSSTAHRAALAEAKRLDDESNPESDHPHRGQGDCPHGVRKGWRCSLCGGIV